MPSPEPPDLTNGASSSASSTSSANASKHSTRPIHAFWSVGSSSSIPAPSPAPPKRKRRKADDATGQARLLGLNGSAWSIGKAEDGASVSGVSDAGTARLKGKKEGGEEAERKEMTKRARQVAAEVKKAKRKQDLRDEEEVRKGNGEGVPEDPAASDPPVTGATNPSPGKRKLGRPRKLRQPIFSPAPSPQICLLERTNGHSSTSPTEVVITGHRHNPDHPSHPFFSRTASNATKGAPHDPISVEDAAYVGPRKLVFASDQKPAHAFFSAPLEVTTQANSPAKEVKEKSSKATAFFKTSGAGSYAPELVRDGWGRGIKEGEGLLAPWPGRDWPSHEAGLGPSTTTGSPRRTRKRQKTSTVHSSPDNDDAAYWSDLLRRASPTSDDHGPISRSYPRYSTPPLCKKHLASTSLAHKNSSSNRDHWCERYRPLRAAEVLGNEVEATYLRDWLSAMQVGSGRRVIRKVSRPKKQFFDGWIVDDIGLFGCADDEDDDEELPEEFEEPNLPLGERPTAYPPLTARFTNTILLTGPHGCGKSAAVYAVATELDWEVFEVYPGIGKRTGANLMSLVGDVGKNHMVVKGGAKEEVDKKGVIKSFFGQTKTNGSPTRLNDSSRGSVHVTIEMQRDKANGHDEVEFRQSLILIDEADILYAEEYTFWPAVVALIAESRRPVILTCNDPAQVPRTQLPLQATLHFHPPPSHLAIPYLDEIADHEGLADFAASDLYARATCRAPDILEHPLPPNGHEPLPYFDLRQAINQLQLDRGMVQLQPVESKSIKGELADSQRQLEIVSFADAFIAPRSWAVMDVTEADRHESSPDDELGISALRKPELSEARPTLPACDRAAEIAEALTPLGSGSIACGELQTARIEYIRSLLPILDPLVPLTSYLLPHPSLFTDYIPTIQQIVEADDTLEAAEEAEVASGGNRVNRKTGRPKRITAGVLGVEGYERYLDAGREALEAVRVSVLR